MRSVGDLWAYALSNLRRHKLRTALTVCGVAVGVATLTVMVSLGSGLRILASSQFDTAELVTRIRVLRSGAKEALQSGLFGGKRKVAAGAPITDETVAELSKLEGVRVAYGEVQTPVTLEANARITQAIVEGLPVAGVTEGYHKALLAGAYWDDDKAGPVCVLPSVVLADLGYARPEDALGARVAVASLFAGARYREETETIQDPDDPQAPPREVTRAVRPEGLEVIELDVIGVFDSKQFGYAGQALHVPLAYASHVAAELDFRKRTEGQFETAVVKVADHRELDAVRKDIEAMGYDTWTVFDVLSTIKVVFVVFQVLLSFFGGIGLVVAFFGIANTMLMAVLERTREIGVLKALGARDRDVRRMFSAEAAAIGLVGGAVGLLIGLAIGETIDAVASRMIGADTDLGRGVFVVEAWLVGAALAVSTLVAAVAGYYPAWRAARLDPVEALRRE